MESTFDARAYEHLNAYVNRKQGAHERLNQIAELRCALEAMTAIEANIAHDHGLTWAEIGRTLGFSRQKAALLSNSPLLKAA